MFGHSPATVAAIARRRLHRADLRHLARVFQRRVPRIDLDSVPDGLKRDLGFADGRMAPPRNPLRD